MKMTAAIIKFSIYVFLVKSDILFTNKSKSPAEEKKPHLLLH